MYASMGEKKPAEKRRREDDGEKPKVKRVKGGFKVGPDNLPDGTWRRKGIAILLHPLSQMKN
jgi:hypothetical protein